MNQQENGETERRILREEGGEGVACSTAIAMDSVEVSRLSVEVS